MPKIRLTTSDLRYVVEQATKTILNEAYGISEIVSVESENIINEINRVLSSPNVFVKEEKCGGGRICVYEYNFRMTVFGELPLGVSFIFRICDNNETVDAYYHDNGDTDRIYFDSKNMRIVLNILTMRYGFDKTKPLNFPLNGELRRLIEHEVKHAYQYYMKRGMFSDKEYDNEKRTELYSIAKNERRKHMLSSEPVDMIKTDIACCIYHSTKAELTAFEQELYRQILNSGVEINKTWDFLKTLDYYQQFSDFKTLINRCEENKECIVEYLQTVYGKSYGWLIKLVENCVKNMRRTMNRAVWRAISVQNENFGLIKKPNKLLEI